MKKPTLTRAIYLTIILALLCPPAALAVTPDDIVVLVEPSLEFDWVEPFSEGVSKIHKNGKWGLVGTSGSIIPVEYSAGRHPIDEFGMAFLHFWNGRVVVGKDDKWGVIDTGGNVVVPFEYDEARAFVEGLAAVCKDGKWGFIDTDGKIIAPLEYDWVDAFSEGLAMVRKGDWEDGKCGYIDTTGNVVIPLEYDSCSDFYNGYAEVRKGSWEDGKYGYIDTSGRVVIPLEYDAARIPEGDGYVGGLEYGLATVGKKREDDSELVWSEHYCKFGLVDLNNNIVLPLEYEYIYFISESLVNAGNWTSNDNGAYIDTQIINISGNIAAPAGYDLVSYYFSEGLAAAKKDEKYGYVDTSGKVMIPFEYDGVGSFNEGLAAVEKDGKYGYIDTSGKVIVTFEYDGAENFSEGFAAVEKDDMWGFIDAIGNVITLLEYDKVWSFNEGRAAVWKGRKLGFISASGKVVIPLEYDFFSTTDEEWNSKIFNEGLVGVAKDGKMGYIDTDGNVAVPFIYDRTSSFSEYIISNFSEGYAWVQKDGLWGVIANTTVAEIENLGDYPTVAEYIAGLEGETTLAETEIEAPAEPVTPNTEPTAMTEPTEAEAVISSTPLLPIIIAAIVLLGAGVTFIIIRKRKKANPATLNTPGH